jgi:hypothetical protein
VVGFGEGTGIVEGAGGGRAGFACMNPFLVVAEAGRDGFRGALEIFKFVFGQEKVFSVIGKEHSFAADEEDAAVPLGNKAGIPEHRFFLPLIPGETDWRHIGTRGILVGGGHGSGREFWIGVRTGRLHVNRGLQLEGPEWKVVPVTAEVTHGAAPEIPPAVPFGAGKINFVEGSFGRGTEPEIPVEASRNGAGTGGAFRNLNDVFVALGGFGGLESPGAADPNMNGRNGTDGVGLDEFDDAAVIGTGVDLRAHLGRDFGFGSSLGDEPGFPDVVGERFFAVDMLPELKRWESSKGVGVLGAANDDGVDVAGVIVEFSEIDVFAGFGMFLGGGIEVAFVHVTKGNDVFRGDFGEVAGAASAGADDGDVEFVAGILCRDDGGKCQERCGAGAGVMQEGSA